MKALWSVLIDSLKEVESQWVALGVGIFGLITLLSATSVVKGFFNMIVSIVEVFGPIPPTAG